MEATEGIIRVVIADDEPLARQLLVRLVQAQPDVSVVGLAKDGASARRIVAESDPDLVFLDVEMPKLSGVELSESWRAGVERPHVIFVTAFDRYALNAFEVDALDYLVKPIEKERFVRAMEKARRAIRAAKVCKLGEQIAAMATPEAGSSSPGEGGAFVTIRQRDEILRFPEDEIIWLEAASQYVQVHTDSARYIVAEPLNRYHARLRSDAFVRVHRSAVVNTAKVTRVLRRQNGVHELRLSNGVSVPLSRSRRALVDRLLGACADNRREVRRDGS
jgi:DNA-binding LytR/AlgR family response regulator